ncbi:MAG: ABC transporter substrate-binding protein [Firmicutes bacterium]|nr:ABC transporter substrate-binding protein [Bacillota bacterium]
MNRALFRRIAAMTFALVMLAGVVAGCSTKDKSSSGTSQSQSGSGAQTQQPKEKVLVVAFPGDIDTFDPAFTVGTRTSQTVIQNTFDQLEQYALKAVTTPDSYQYWVVDTSKIQPMLAEKTEVVDGGKAILFHLRHGVKYSDGKEMTAQDVVNGYRRIFEAKGISYWLLTMGGVMKPDYFEVVDPYTVKIRMDVPNNLVRMNNIMHNTSSIRLSDVQAHATSSDQWATDYFKKNLAPGNGPFILEEYKPGDRIVLKANPGYWQGKPKFDKVILKIIPDATQRLLLLKKGDVDIVEDPPVKELDALKQDPNLRVLSVETPRVGYLQMNFSTPPFDNVKVRKAVAYAVPYDNIVKDVYKGYALRAMSLIGKGMPGHDPSPWTYNTDLEKAKQMLAEAGFPNGQGLPPVKLTVQVAREEDERAAVYIANNLKAIGLNVTVEKLPYAQFNELQQGGKLQMWLDYWISWVNDPFYHLSWIVGSGSPTNYNHYKNARVDQMIKQWTLNTDEAGRLGAAKEIQKILADDVAHVYLVQPTWNVPMRKNIEGYAYLNDELLRFWYLDKK